MLARMSAWRKGSRITSRPSTRWVDQWPLVSARGAATITGVGGGAGGGTKPFDLMGKAKSMPLPGENALEGNVKNSVARLRKHVEKFGVKWVPLMPQKWKKAVKPVPAKKGDVEVTVMQFNMLSDGLCNAYYSEGHEKAFLNVVPASLRWTYRGVRLVELIMERGLPDIVCIEECDQPEFFDRYLTKMGYEKGFFLAKPNSQTRNVAKQILSERPELAQKHKELGTPFTVAKDGLYVAVRKEKLRVMGQWQVTATVPGLAIKIDDTKRKMAKAKDPKKLQSKLAGFEAMDPKKHELLDNIAQVVKVGLAGDKHAASPGHFFYVMSTHLKSTKTVAGEAARVQQLTELFNEHIPRVVEGWDAIAPVMFACDLNATPVDQKTIPARAYPYVVDKGAGLKFDSGYVLASGAEPLATTFKERVTGVAKMTIDYIFLRNHAAKILPTHFLEIPQGQMIPNWAYPSDHFALALKVILRLAPSKRASAPVASKGVKRKPARAPKRKLT